MKLKKKCKECGYYRPSKRTYYKCYTDKCPAYGLNKDMILKAVDRALESQFEGYSFSSMINDTLLTEKEKEWAKENISYKAYIFE